MIQTVVPLQERIDSMLNPFLLRTALLAFVETEIEVLGIGRRRQSEASHRGPGSGKTARAVNQEYS